MKKLLALTMLLLSLSIIFASCDNNQNDEHEHTIEVMNGFAPTCTQFGMTDGEVCTECTVVITPQEQIPATGHTPQAEWTVLIEASCSQTGSKTLNCATCGIELEMANIPMLEHEWVVTSRTDATCTENGEIIYNCNNCPQTKLETIAHEGHKPADEWTVDVEATCSQSGYRSHHCTVCGNSLDFDPIEQLEHTYDGGRVTEEPDCVHNGMTVYTCKVCSHEHWEMTEPTGVHSFSEEWTIDQGASCTDDGWKSRHCTVLDCHDFADKTTIPATGHTWEETGYVMSTPSCQQEGHTRYSCTECLEGKNDVYTPALGHDWQESWTVEKAANCNTAGVESRGCNRYGCIVRETREIPKTTHIWGNWVLDYDATCTTNGQEISTCSICNSKQYNQIPATGIHDWENDWTVVSEQSCTENGYKYIKCKNCTAKKDETTAPAYGHSFDQNDICTKCNKPHCTEGLEFTLINNGTEYAVSGIGNTTDLEIIIPKEYNGKPVTAIAENAFFGNQNITGLSCMKGSQLKSIGNYAFDLCGALTQVVLPDSVTSIGEYAFSDCYKLETVTFGDGSELTSIGFNAFNNCSALKEITIPEKVTEMGEFAFSSCRKLEKVTFKCEILSLNNYIFNYCTALTEITLPDSVTSIGDSAFANCTSLSKIHLPKSLTSIGIYAFNKCTSLDGVDIDNLEMWSGVTFANSTSNPFCNGADLYVNGTLITNLIIPESITTINESLFDGCTSIKEITIHDNLKKIEANAFLGCTAIEKVHVSSFKVWFAIEFTYEYDMYQLSDKLFINGSNIENLIIPADAENIPAWAFRNSTTITTLTISDGVKTIGDHAFESCSSLTTVYIPKSVTSIGSDVFNWCRAEETEETLHIYYDGIKDEWNSIVNGQSWTCGTYRYTIHYSDGTTTVYVPPVD